MRGRAGITAAALALVASAMALVVPDAAFAHALASRADLPIPEWLFAWGASLVLIVSFALLSVAWLEPRLQADSWRPVSARISEALTGRPASLFAGTIGAALLLIVLYAGFEGRQDPARNLTLTFVFVTFWLGMTLLSVLFGDVFRAFNPWRAIARFFSAIFRLVARQAPPAPLSYPERLGHLPAVAGVIGFVWIELVYGGAGIEGGLAPETVALAALIYTAITFVAMALFGIETWIERGEAFSVYLRMFASLSPLEVRDGRLGRRKPLSGATEWGMVPWSLALVLVSIATTSFDGAQEGALATPIRETFDLLRDAGFGVVTSFRINGSIWIAISIVAATLLYTLGVRGMHTVRGSPPAAELARSFAHTLIPIALAYLVAHYFSLFVFQGQAQFTYLLSDPLAEGSDLFGTASGGIDYGLIGANAIWYVQVGALVAGHVAALTLAHDRALAVYGDTQRATRSQYWM
ncbi:MAG: fenitrothion hydrolase, partial [Solirubrobacterales bacterium]